jgi:hypothetical protein
MADDIAICLRRRRTGELSGQPATGSTCGCAAHPQAIRWISVTTQRTATIRIDEAGAGRLHGGGQILRLSVLGVTAMNNRSIPAAYCAVLAACCAGFFALVAATPARADDAGIQRDAMQQALNRQVMSAPFSPGDVARAQAYADAALRGHVAPVANPPAYWQPGWTCGDLTRYPSYSYGDYRDCVYYDRYYGHPW